MSDHMVEMPSSISNCAAATVGDIRSRIVRNKQAIIDNIKFIAFVIIPILTCIVVIPYIVNPFTIEEFKTNFKVVLLTQPFCQLRPEECSQLLDPNYGDPRYLKRKEFEFFELVYVRHYLVEMWDNFVLRLVRVYPLRRFIMILIQILDGPLENAEQFWKRMDESTEVVLAVFNSMFFATIQGVIVSRMWVFLIFGFIITISESWANVMETLSRVLRTANTVF
ncbi:hypothetical protein DFJ63DRAFT_313335 [Scheffersomyces coipomensis]|uniref:uncharacterized protein n=1 Tax=Scheffersomyces coipomensis TaxID=1788519 RepID=UPI00315D1331